MDNVQKHKIICRIIMMRNRLEELMPKVEEEVAIK
jgi:hypothetical protein